MDPLQAALRVSTVPSRSGVVQFFLVSFFFPFFGFLFVSFCLSFFLSFSLSLSLSVSVSLMSPSSGPSCENRSRLQFLLLPSLSLSSSPFSLFSLWKHFPAGLVNPNPTTCHAWAQCSEFLFLSFFSGWGRGRAYVAGFLRFGWLLCSPRIPRGPGMSSRCSRAGQGSASAATWPSSRPSCLPRCWCGSTGSGCTLGLGLFFT